MTGKHRLIGAILVSLFFAAAVSPLGAARWVPLNGVQAQEETPRIELLKSDNSEIQLRVSLTGFTSDIVSTGEGDFNSIALPDEGYTNVIGEPKLPVIRRLVEIPYGAAVELVTGRTVMHQDRLEAFGLSHRIVPVQPPVEKGHDAQSKQPFVLDRSVYERSQYLIGETARISDEGYLRGHRWIMIEIFPFDYNPAEGSLRIISDIEVTVKLTGSDAGLTRRMKERYNDPYTRKLTGRLFLNGGAYDDPDLIPPPLGFLIITNNHYASLPVVQEYVNWKTQKGFHTTVATTETIGSTTNQIKAYIQNAYDNWDIPPCFVQLIGDVNVIPEWVGSGSGNPHTDLYYGTLEGGDAFADVGVGRFSPSTDVELANMINKTLQYEQVGWTGNDEWEKWAVFMASNDNYTVSEGTHNFVIDNYLAPDGYRCDRLYSHTYSATTAQVTASLNDGRSLAIYSGHGSVTSWADGPPFSQANVRALVNEVYPFVCSHACLTGQFQYGECFGETWIRVENGALAFWGSSVTSYWDEDDILEKRMFEGFFDVQWPGEDQNLTWISGMTDYAKYELWQYYGGGGTCLRYDEMYNVLGDASVDLWTDIPQQLTVNYPGAVLIGQNQIQVTVAGYPDWALVHIYSDAEDMQFTQYVDNGTATFNLGSGFTVPGTLHISVTGHDCQPYFGTASIIPPSGPYVIFNSLEVDDSVTGNNNGQLDYAETVQLSITVENVGVAPATNVWLTITSLDPLLTISDSTGYVGSIAPGATATATDEFTVAASPDLPDQYALACQLDATDGMEVWTTSFTITGHAPVVEYASLIVHDDTGNQNGNLDPGESADLEVILTNNGSCGVDDVAFTALTLDPYITITQATGTVGTLPTGGQNSGTFSVEVSPSCPQEHSVRFTLDVTGANGYTGSTEFTTIVGNILYDPTGPDNYGYSAYDSYDAPENPQYDWVEICADSSGPGTLVNFTQDDQVFQFDLPFTFQYYGQTFNRYTIGANGWVAMGEVLQDDYSNSGIPNGDGPAAMIAPYWEDLSPQRQNSGKVWRWYDETNHRLIVEYNHVEQYAPTGSFETFQVILLDPAYYSTSTGDGRILFQYKDMSVTVQNEGTVGIENPAETDGLQILFDGNYDEHIAPIENGMVILFSTPTGTPEMLVDLTYVSGSPVPPSGGNVYYEIYVENTGTSPVSFTGWLDLAYEGGTPTLIAQRSFTGFQPGWTINRPDMYFPVPASYAAGNYTFSCKVGVYPDVVWAQDSFPFVKSGDADGSVFIPFLPDEPFPDPFAVITGAGEESLVTAPDEFRLEGNYPNPFNPTTTIAFSLPQATHVKLTVYNVNGQEVATLVDGQRDAGVHEVTFDASQLASGIYFTRIEAGDFTAVRKMVLMK